MKILALEFSSDQRSVAVVEDGQVRSRAQDSGVRPGSALGAVETALQEARLEREHVDCLAVGLGPGSYAGVRSAIALAQGWQLALGTKIIGISSVECLAARAQHEKIFGRVNIIIDAQRNELYLAAYDVQPTGYQEVEALRLAGMKEVMARAAAGELVVGPEAPKWFRAARVLFPDAAMLGQLAAGHGDVVPGEKLEPIYLRQTSFAKAAPPRIIPAA